MSIIDEALRANAAIANDYDPSRVKPPAPKIAIVTCADPRLSWPTSSCTTCSTSGLRRKFAPACKEKRL